MAKHNIEYRQMRPENIEACVLVDDAFFAKNAGNIS